MQAISIRYGASVWQAAQSTGLPAAPAAGALAAAPWGQPRWQPRQDASLQTLRGVSMGTGWSLRLVNTDFRPLAQAQQLVEQTLAQVVAEMSHWAHDSVLTEWNRSPAGSTLCLPQALAQVIDAAAHWHAASGGAYDPSLGALVQVWGFGPRAQPQMPHTGSVPSPAAIAWARQHSGWHRVQWDAQSATLWQPGGVQLDLSGIAKGFAVDSVAQRLQQAGWAHGLLEIGGELKAWGHRPDGQAWHAGLSLGEAQAPLPIPLHDGGALATSGDCWHGFEHDGVRYSHTIDPRTGWPVPNPLRSVTVWHAQCMHADALATVLTVLGAEAAWEFAVRHEVAAVLQPPGAHPAQRTPAWHARFGEKG